MKAVLTCTTVHFLHLKQKHNLRDVLELANKKKNKLNNTKKKKRIISSLQQTRQLGLASFLDVKIKTGLANKERHTDKGGKMQTHWFINIPMKQINDNIIKKCQYKLVQVNDFKERF